MRYTLRIDLIPSFETSSNSIAELRRKLLQEAVIPLPEQSLFTAKIQDNKIDQTIYIIRGRRRTILKSNYEKLSISHLKPPKGHGFRTKQERENERNSSAQPSSELYA